MSPDSESGGGGGVRHILLWSLGLLAVGATLLLVPLLWMDDASGLAVVALVIVRIIGGLVGFAGAMGMSLLYALWTHKRESAKEAEQALRVKPDRILHPFVRDNWFVISSRGLMHGVGCSFVLGVGVAGTAIGLWLDHTVLAGSVLYAIALDWIIAPLVDRGDAARLEEFAEHHPEARPGAD